MIMLDASSTKKSKKEQGAKAREKIEKEQRAIEKRYKVRKM